MRAVFNHAAVGMIALACAAAGTTARASTVIFAETGTGPRSITLSPIGGQYQIDIFTGAPANTSFFLTQEVNYVRLGPGNYLDADTIIPDTQSGFTPAQTEAHYTFDVLPSLVVNEGNGYTLHWNVFSDLRISVYAPEGTPYSVTVRGQLQPANVPEPATWALMFLGFGAAGAALRRRRIDLAALG